MNINTVRVPLTFRFLNHSCYYTFDHIYMFYRKYLNRQTNSSKEAASQIDDTRVTSETNAADQAQLRHRNENTFQETQR